MGENTPKLNTLDRFSKSSRLILEEHGHCEVPAGCGGVILRWWNPQTNRPLQIWIYTPGVIEEFFIDGQQPESARPLLSIGTHVLAIKLADLPAGTAALCFAGQFDANSEYTAQSTSASADRLIISQPDGTWRATSTEPADGWTGSGFDDSDWMTMETGKLKQPDASTQGAYQYKRVMEFGGMGLGPRLPVSGWMSQLFEKGQSRSSVLYIRKAFVVAPRRSDE